MSGQQRPKTALSSRTVHHTPWMRVREDRIVEPDGHVSLFGVVERAPFVVVLCAVRADSIILLRQFRYAAGRWLWELPQGGVEDGEDLARAAARELREETGWRADRVTVLLNGLYEAGDWATQTFGVALVDPGGRETLGPCPGEYVSDVRAVPARELNRMILAGEIVDPPTICALHVWEHYRIQSKAEVKLQGSGLPGC
ncbi:NUDIX domain-containing protein [Actinomadura rubrisoli]|uniref:NUDIX hydrolase n=1 Tax=Actinomadura rubrisoli TaxID=2530368 RepID=A0A4R5CHL9_9ACTN|nr:NUDIX hydrolase [Actinomadura rubrisoli]TDD96792.1 NUDIX hydrolase [Actinomadura rubrisoli]